MEGKVVAVTGGASGIGLATAKVLASRGAKLSIADVASQDALDATVALIKQDSPQADIIAFTVDVRDVAQVADWLKATIDKFGRLDHAASIAGVWRESKIEEHDEDIWDFVIGVNLTGTMHVIKESLKLFQDKAGCSIVNVASVAGIMGLPGGQSAYCASKHGIVGLTRSVAKDIGSRGIRINCVAPGVIHTPMMDAAEEKFGTGSTVYLASQQPIGRRADAAEVAKVIAFLLSEDSSFVTGSVYPVDGGFTS